MNDKALLEQAKAIAEAIVSTCDYASPEVNAMACMADSPLVDAARDFLADLAQQEAAPVAPTESQGEPVAWLYTLEYGTSVADTKISKHQLNYPFGVCGADYLRGNDDGVSYVRQTPLYLRPVVALSEDAMIALTAAQNACNRVVEQYGGIQFGIDFRALGNCVAKAIKGAK